MSSDIEVDEIDLLVQLRGSDTAADDLPADIEQDLIDQENDFLALAETGAPAQYNDEAEITDQNQPESRGTFLEYALNNAVNVDDVTQMRARQARSKATNKQYEK